MRLSFKNRHNGPRATKRRFSSLSVAVGLLLIGCTGSLDSTRISAITEPTRGLVYSLAMMQYELEITRQIRNCSVPQDASGELYSNFTISVDISEQMIPDPNQTFLLDYENLSTATNVSDVRIKLRDDGRLESINVDADDRTAEVIGNVATFARNVALTAMGIPGVSVDQAGGGDRLICRPRVASALASLRSSAPALGEATADLTAATALLARQMAVLQAIEKPSAELVGDVRDAMNRVVESSRRQAALQSQRAADLRYVRLTHTVRWPVSSTEWNQSYVPAERAYFKQFGVSTAFIREWLEEAPPDPTQSQTGYFREGDVLDALTVSVSLRPLVQPPASGAVAEHSDVEHGIYYRRPVPSELTVCYTSECGEEVAEDNAAPRQVGVGANFIGRELTSPPQLGRLVVIPFDNGLFESGQLEVEFADNGVPTLLHRAHREAPAEVFTGVLAGISEQLPDLRARFDAAEQGAELAALQRRAEILQQQAAIAEAERILADTDTTDVEAETAYVDAQVALAEAEIKLIDAERRLAAARVEEAEGE